MSGIFGESPCGLAIRIAMASITALLLRGLLDFTYIYYVDRFFAGTLGGSFFLFNNIESLRLLESYTILFLLAVALGGSLYWRWRPSGIALVIYFVFVVLPISSLYGLTDVPALYFYAVAGCFAVLLVITALLPRVRVPRPGRDLVYLGVTTLLLICAYVYSGLLLSGGLERLSFSLLTVYEVRSEYIATRLPFMGYFVPWQANVINIFILFYALEKRNYWLLSLACIAQLLLFGMTGFKSFILSPMFSVAVYFLYNKRNFLSLFFCLTFVLILGSYILYLATDEHIFPSLLIRRLFYVPAANHFIYYDFFSQTNNHYIMLSNSILSPFIQYPYEMPLTRVISWAYWGRDFGPNVGYLGDAFAQFGFAGMLVFSVILGIFLRIVDCLARGLPDRFVAAVIATPAMALTNSALFTCLLTHGLILATVLLWLLRARTRNKPQQQVKMEEWGEPPPSGQRVKQHRSEEGSR